MTLALLVAVSGCHRITPEPSAAVPDRPVPAITDARPASGTAHYYNPIGYSFDAPEEWIATRLYPSNGPDPAPIELDVATDTDPHAPSIGALFNDPPRGTPILPNVAIYAKERPSYTDDDYIALNTAKLTRFGADIISVTKRRIAGHEAIEIVSSVGDAIWSSLIVIHYGRRRLVVAQQRAPKVIYQTFQPVVEQLLASIRFEEAFAAGDPDAGGTPGSP